MTTSDNRAQEPVNTCAGQVDANDDRRWTVMVFMGTETMAGTESLQDAFLADLAEMKQVGSGGPLNIFVEVHGDDGHRRCQLFNGPDDVWEPAPLPGQTRSGQALGEFITWALNIAQPRPQDHSMLVMWGHAYEFAMGHALTRGGVVDALDFVELSRLLQRLQERFGGGENATPRKLDILGFDACDVTTVEMSCQLHPYANYLLGSEIGIPIPGWPYDRILGRLREPIGRLMGPAEFGSFAVRRYCEAYTALRTVALTLLDLAQVQELFARADVLALTLASAMTKGPDVVERIAYLFSQSQTADDKPFVDVADLCVSLVRNSGEPLVMEAARALGDFLISPKAHVVNGSEDGVGKPFIVEHGRNAGGTARLNGLSIYAPHVVPGYEFEAVRHLYETFDFARETGWSAVVHNLAKQS